MPGGGGPPRPECLAEWRVTNAGGRPGADGKAAVRQRCRDGDAGCDADPSAGTCTFTVALCFDRRDPRLPRCHPAAIESWTLVKPAAGQDVDDLLAAAARLGPSTTAAGTVSFVPPLDASERCTDPVEIVVPTRGRRPGVRVLRTRTTAAAGHPRDADALKLVCVR